MTTVTFNGKTYTLTGNAEQENYGTDGGVRYYQSAISESGEEAKIAWDVTKEWEFGSKVANVLRGIDLSDASEDQLAEIAELEEEYELSAESDVPDFNDESNACEWDSPSDVKFD